MNLQEIRERLSELDRQVLALVAERQRLSREVAEAKRAEGKALTVPPRCWSDSPSPG